MQTQFKVTDSVQLLHGYTPTMSISQFDEQNENALCVWYDSKTKKINKEWIPVNVLKSTPERKPINVEDVLSPFGIKI